MRRFRPLRRTAPPRRAGLATIHHRPWRLPIRSKRGSSGSTAPLDPARVGRDASRIADEVIAHLAGLVGAEVVVTLEIDARLAGGAPDQVIRTVTENSRTLRFTSQGF